MYRRDEMLQSKKTLIGLGSLLVLVEIKLSVVKKGIFRVIPKSIFFFSFLNVVVCSFQISLPSRRVSWHQQYTVWCTSCTQWDLFMYLEMFDCIVNVHHFANPRWGPKGKKKKKEWKGFIQCFVYLCSMVDFNFVRMLCILIVLVWC